MKIQDVINKCDCSWEKDVIIRYLYINLAPFFQRDINFFFAPEAIKLKYLKSDENVSWNLVNCYRLCAFFQELFETFEINSIIVPTNNKTVPHFALLVEGSKNYLIDPLKNLMNNQALLRDESYGTTPPRTMNCNNIHYTINSLPPEEKLYIDSFLGFEPTNSILLDEYRKNIITNKARAFLESHIDYQTITRDIDYNNLQDLKLLFWEQDLLNRSVIPGPMERCQYYIHTLKSICNKSDRRYFGIALTKDSELFVIHSKTDTPSNLYKLYQNEHGKNLLVSVSSQSEDYERIILNPNDDNVKVKRLSLKYIEPHK